MKAFLDVIAYLGGLLAGLIFIFGFLAFVLVLVFAPEEED